MQNRERMPAQGRGIVRKSLRIMMHALAVFLLLVAVATPVFWVRSRSRDDWVWVWWNSIRYGMESWNSRAMLYLSRVPPEPLNWNVRSFPRVPDATDAWSYTAIGWDPSGPDHTFNFLGVAVGADPGGKEQWVETPYSYLLLFCLSVPTWWFWRVRRQRKKRQSGFPVQPRQAGLRN